MQTSLTHMFKTILLVNQWDGLNPNVLFNKNTLSSPCCYGCQYWVMSNKNTRSLSWRKCPSCYGCQYWVMSNKITRGLSWRKCPSCNDCQCSGWSKAPDEDCHDNNEHHNDHDTSADRYRDKDARLFTSLKMMLKHLKTHMLCIIWRW